MNASNLPPGVTPAHIPGNQPEPPVYSLNETRKVLRALTDMAGGWLAMATSSDRNGMFLQASNQHHIADLLWEMATVISKDGINAGMEHLVSWQVDAAQAEDSKLWHDAANISAAMAEATKVLDWVGSDDTVRCTECGWPISPNQVTPYCEVCDA